MKCVLNADEYMLIEQGLSELEKIMKRNLFSPENRLEGKVYFKEDIEEIKALRKTLENNAIKFAEKINKKRKTQSKDEWLVFNATDGVLAHPEAMKKSEIEPFIRSFRNRFNRQGYYLTSRGFRIAPADIKLEARRRE